MFLQGVLMSIAHSPSSYRQQINNFPKVKVSWQIYSHGWWNLFQSGMHKCTPKNK